MLEFPLAQTKPVASAREDILDAAAELIVAAHGLAVGLSPGIRHPTPSSDVILSAWAWWCRTRQSMWPPRDSVPAQT